MPIISLDEVKNLVPDQKAFTTAKKIATAKNWDTIGLEDKVLWGIAIGSSGDKYYTLADVANGNYQCSCPSRKRPCKHVLALLILDASEHPIATTPIPDSHASQSKARYSSFWE